jgi:hypothetical protein
MAIKIAAVGKRSFIVAFSGLAGYMLAIMETRGRLVALALLFLEVEAVTLCWLGDLLILRTGPVLDEEDRRSQNERNNE